LEQLSAFGKMDPARDHFLGGKRSPGLNDALRYKPGKMLERTVIGPLGICREKAGRHLPDFQVIADTIAADAFSGAGFIAAIAVLHILVLLTIHNARSSISETKPAWIPNSNRL
jgi:hypothetical protein